MAYQYVIILNFKKVATSCTHPKCPDNVPGCTRGEVFNSGYEIVPDVRIYLELICFSEKWFIVLFLLAGQSKQLHFDIFY